MESVIDSHTQSVPSETLCTLSIIPILWPAVIFGEQIGLDLGWIYLFTGVLVASTVVPVALSLIWERNTAMGVS